MVDEFGEDGVLIVSNTAGAAGEEEQVYYLCIRLIRRVYLKRLLAYQSFDILQKFPSFRFS